MKKLRQSKEQRSKRKTQSNAVFFTVALCSLTFALCSCPLAVVPAALWDGILDPSRAIDWSQAGVDGDVPLRTTLCSTLNANVTADQINGAIQSCPAGQVVQLSAGRYTLTSGLIMKSGVVVRGAGADQTILTFTGDTACAGAFSNVCFLGGDSSDWSGSSPVQPGASQAADWVGGFAKDTDQITLTNIGSNGIRVGQYLYLDQDNDTATSAGLFQCEEDTANPPCSLEGGKANPGRVINGIARQQLQVVRVTGCSPSCADGAAFTISPSLHAPNWSASKHPGAWWSREMIEHAGLEDLTVDSTASGSLSNVSFFNAAHSWLKGTRQVKNCDCERNVVSMSQSAHLTIRDNYIYGMTGHSVHYGVEAYTLSDTLISNNIFQHTDAPMMLHSNVGSVYSWNYAINDTYDDGRLPQYHWMSSSIGGHSGGVMYNLFEGNVGPGLGDDVFHGNQVMNTAFRNYFLGSDPGRIDSTIAVRVESWCRYFNLVGNVLGTPGYTTLYEGGNEAVYDLGEGRSNDTVTVPDDPLVKSTMLRWGNWDVVTKAVRWCGNSSSPGWLTLCGGVSEVPSSLLQYANAVPSSQALPSSFYLTTRPAWWPAGMVWPPIGPDRTGGEADLGGMVYPIPSQACYAAVMQGPADGTGPPLSFNANACYGAGSPLSGGADTQTGEPLSRVKVYPNPWRSDKHAGRPITFANLAAGGSLRIFTLSGHLVRHWKTTVDSVGWDLKNEKSGTVASGIYVFIVTDGQGHQRRGKFAVVR